ncbi:MAG: hypothetical protein U5L45_14950 [Saprospiraceae bacterium]|nr:hypothetical protein [Saprospiraceae bacterium]
MKILRSFILFIAVVCLVSSCYKEQDFWADNVTVTDKAVPFIYMYALDSTTFTPGTKARVLLEFYCKDPLKEIRLHQSTGTSIANARTLISTTPYKPAYSAIRQMDTLVLSYTVPAGNPANTTIFLHGEAVSTKDVAKGSWEVTRSSRSFRTK